MLNQISKEVKAIVCAESERLADLLKSSNLDPITKVSVNEFEYKFLPLLANIGEDFDTNAWIREVSHPFVRLHVIDDNGDVKYDIPSLLAQQETKEVEGTRIVDHTDTIESMSSDNPRVAMAYINRLLSKFEDKQFDSEASAAEMVRVLNTIFTDYRMPLLPEEGLPDAAPTAVPTKASIIEYEDF